MAKILRKPKPHYGIHQRFPSLRRHGLAVEYFPRFVNRTECQHSVDVVLLSVILRGRGRHVMGDEVYQESGGSVSVTHYGQKHDIVTDARGMDIYNVYLDLRNHPLPMLPESLRPTLAAILPIHPRLAHHLNRRVWIRMDNSDRLAASLGRIEAEMNGSKPGALEIVQHSFQVFLIDLCRAARRQDFVLPHAANGNFPAWVEKIRRELDLHFARPHDLSTLASDSGVSVAYVCRLFKAYTGKTVVEYMVERRIQAALWKLREDDTKIISIALACGFNDLAYFNRTFKRIVGTTPSSYRRRMKKPVPSSISR